MNMLAAVLLVTIVVGPLAALAFDVYRRKKGWPQ